MTDDTEEESYWLYTDREIVTDLKFNKFLYQIYTCIYQYTKYIICTVEPHLTELS